MVKRYLHNPPHLFIKDSLYFITGATYQKRLYFKSKSGKELLLDSMFFLSEKFSCNIYYWVILNNHYHMVIDFPEKEEPMPKFINRLHSYTSLKLNKAENTIGKKRWWNYWDKCITYEKSLYPRINYIHFNPVKHGYVSEPEDYDFSSYNHYLKNNEVELNEIMKKYPFDKIKIHDEF